MVADQRRDTWQNLLHAWDVPPTQADRKFEEILQAYSGPGRFYHTLDHVMDVLNTVKRLAAQAKNLNAVKLAAWLHDVIYDSRRGDNEELSAEYAERLCTRLSIPNSAKVASLIRKTKTHAADDDADSQVLIDADLAILGAPEPRYWDYSEKIRREYDWVPESDYLTGRRKVLEHFLARPRIYQYLNKLEGPARRNLAAEILKLGALLR